MDRKRWLLAYESGDLEIVTCTVDDAPKPYETGIRHPEYNDHQWIIVEVYKAQPQAEQGHWKWVNTMTKTKPEALHEVGESVLARMLDHFYKGNKAWRTMVRKKPPT